GKILIASGTRPAIPHIPGLEGTGIITSDEALRLKEQPRVLTIIGGGFIAAELGHFFGALGTKVNIVQKSHLLLPHEDLEIAAKFTELFKSKYNVYVNSTVESVERDASGIFRVSIREKVATEVRMLESDQLLVAAGRTPNSDLLDIAKSGVKTDAKGFVIVDEYLQTSVKGIFALGDVVGRYQFKHAANQEARYAFNNIVKPEAMVPVDYTAMPHAVFSSPQVAGVGSTEEELKAGGVAYKKSIYRYADTAMGHALEDREGFVKLLVSDEHQDHGAILGCHILGSEAAILIHEVLVAMKAGLTAYDLGKVIHIHPALSEVVSRAAAQV
ncbi:MAG TPA: FAD-dependent oxidoreductase, partial [Nitrososphaera sp.]|nr:FAD-dependent oxidoreductase [Nitrososphaera sp.]